MGSYFPRHFAILKYLQYNNYMFSRILLACTALIFVSFISLDAFHLHRSDGGLSDFLLAGAFVVFANVFRKLVLRLIQLRERDHEITIVEEPNDPQEPRWVHVGFRIPFGIRRGLVGILALAMEAFFVLLMILVLIAKGVGEGLLSLPAFVPQVFSTVTFPVESWRVLAIFEGALVISWINNAIFLLKYPIVREKLLQLLNDYLLGLHPVHMVAGQVAEHFYRRGATDRDRCPEEVAAQLLALLPREKMPEDGQLGDRERRMRKLIAEVLVVLRKNRRDPPPQVPTDSKTP